MSTLSQILFAQKQTAYLSLSLSKLLSFKLVVPSSENYDPFCPVFGGQKG
jgi:hypothetical protein